MVDGMVKNGGIRRHCLYCAEEATTYIFALVSILLLYSHSLSYLSKLLFLKHPTPVIYFFVLSVWKFDGKRVFICYLIP